MSKRVIGFEDMGQFFVTTPEGRREYFREDFKEALRRIVDELDASVAREAVLREALTEIVESAPFPHPAPRTVARNALSQPSAAAEAFRARVRREALDEVRIEMLGAHSTYTTWSYVQISDELHRIHALADKEGGT